MEFRGQGLFAPVMCGLRLLPAPAGNGVTLRRVDLADEPVFRASARAVFSPGGESTRDAARHTVVVPGPGRPGVHTVEHLLSALWGLGITDAHAEVDGPEVPMLDASALPFASAIRRAGVCAATGPGGAGPEPIVVTEPIELRGACGARLVAEPATGPELVLEYRLDYGASGGPVLGAQGASFSLNWASPDADGYIERVAPARTFCTQREADTFKEAGFFAHLGAGDVLIAGPQGPVGSGLRMPGEPAVHKLLDMLGDLALAGRPVYARVLGERSGHTLNHQLARRLMDLA